jgi:hypothetical protein
VEYLARTGDRAAQQVAHAEAIGYFTRALELLRGLPESTARDSQELDLQMALSWSLFVARGPQAPEREPALVRSREPGEQLGDTRCPPGNLGNLLSAQQTHGIGTESRLRAPRSQVLRPRGARAGCSRPSHKLSAYSASGRKRMAAAV